MLKPFSLAAGLVAALIDAGSAGAQEVKHFRFAYDQPHSTGYGVAADRNGNVGVTGDFLGTINFGQASLTSAGSLDVFVIKLAP